MISGMQGLNRITRLLLSRLLPGLLGCLLATAVRAESMLMVLSDYGPSYNQVRDAVMETVQQPPTVVTLDQVIPSHSRSHIILAVGSQACEQMLGRYHPDTRLICSFLPSSTFTQLRERLLPEQDQNAVSAIFIWHGWSSPRLTLWDRHWVMAAASCAASWKPAAGTSGWLCSSPS